jgi:hypothetical protein
VLDAVELAIVLLELGEMLEDVTDAVGDEADREPGVGVLVNTASELGGDVAAALVKVVVVGSGPGRGEDDVVLDEAAPDGVV